MDTVGHASSREYNRRSSPHALSHKYDGLSDLKRSESRFQSSIGALGEQRTMGFKRGSVNHSVGPQGSMTYGHHPSPAKEGFGDQLSPSVLFFRRETF